jgi:hypothetical protein
MIIDLNNCSFKEMDYNNAKLQYYINLFRNLSVYEADRNHFNCLGYGL